MTRGATGHAFNGEQEHLSCLPSRGARCSASRTELRRRLGDPPISVAPPSICLRTPVESAQASPHGRASECTCLGSSTQQFIVSRCAGEGQGCSRPHIEVAGGAGRCPRVASATMRASPMESTPRVHRGPVVAALHWQGLGRRWYADETPSLSKRASPIPTSTPCTLSRHSSPSIAVANGV